MKPLPLKSVVLQGLLVAFMGWLYGGDLVRLLRLSSAKVTVMTAPPSLALSVAGLLVAVAFGGSLAMASLKRLPARWRVRRLALVAVVTLMAIDFGLLANRRAPMSAEESLVLTLHAFAEEASAESRPGMVLRDPQALQTLAARAPAPPLFVGGEKLATWKVELRERCGGPATAAGSAPAGTFVYCVAEDHARAWVTVVATRGAQTFGDAELVGAEAPWVAQVVGQEQQAPAESPVWDSPTPDEAP